MGYKNIMLRSVNEREKRTVSEQKHPPQHIRNIVRRPYNSSVHVGRGVLFYFDTSEKGLLIALSYQ